MSYPEAPDTSGKAPDHKDAALRAQAGEANNTPMTLKRKTHFKHIPDINYLRAYHKMHKTNLSRMSEEQLEGWFNDCIKHSQRFPRTYCGEFVKDVTTTDDTELVTCKVCKSAIKKEARERQKAHEMGLLTPKMDEGRFFLRELYDLQDSTIEHAEPKDSGEISYFIEPAGDIFRELTLKNPDGNYISEKLRKLNKFFGRSIGDIKEIEQARANNPSYSINLQEYIKKVQKLKNKTASFDFKEYTERKPDMLKALDVIITIAEHGRGNYHGSKVVSEIEELSRMIKG